MFVCLYVYIEWLCQAWPFRGHRLQNFGKNRAEAPRPRPPCQRFPWVFEGRHGWAPPAAWPRRLKPAAQPWLGSWWNESMTRNIWRHQILKKKHALHIECKRLTWSILLKHTLDIQQRIGGYCGNLQSLVQASKVNICVTSEAVQRQITKGILAETSSFLGGFFEGWWWYWRNLENGECPKSSQVHWKWLGV